MKNSAGFPAKLRRWLRRALPGILFFPPFVHDYRRFKRLARQGEPRFELRWRDRYPCLDDRTANTDFDRHYIYHTAWAARVLAKTRPAVHVDIGSSLYFVGMVSAFVPVKFYDFRPPHLQLDGVETGQADIAALPFAGGSIPSLSCMHVVEHIGLGRYGDRLDPDGDLRAMAELKRVLAPGGQLLFVVPIGQPKIMFNAHRIYAHRQIIDGFADLSLVEFSLIPDSPRQGHLMHHASAETADAQRYGCGCFWFRKR